MSYSSESCVSFSDDSAGSTTSGIDESSYLELTPELLKILDKTKGKAAFKYYDDPLDMKTFQKSAIDPDKFRKDVLIDVITSDTAMMTAAGIFGLVLVANAPAAASETAVVGAVIGASNAVAATSALGSTSTIVGSTVATTSIKATVLSALKSAAIPVLGTIGVVALFGSVAYIGYLCHCDSLEEDRRDRIKKHATALDNHRRVLETIQSQARQIQTLKDQILRSGEVTVDQVPVRYRTNQCPIDLEDLISPQQRRLFMLPCGHVLHFDCYSSLLRAEHKICPFDRSPLFPVVPELPPIPNEPILESTPHPSFGKYVKNVVYNALKTTANIVTIAGIVIGQITGAVLIALGAGTIVLWIPTLVPTVLFIGVATGRFKDCVQLVASVLGMAGLSLAGGVILYSITTNV